MPGDDRKRQQRCSLYTYRELSWAEKKRSIRNIVTQAISLVYYYEPSFFLT